MQSKLNRYLIFGFLFLLTTCLFVGVYSDDEFPEQSLFVKYRPTLKMKFYSPIGQSDLTLEDLEPNQQLEENAFQEFVKNHDEPIIPSEILIQLTLTFLCLGMYQLRKNVSFNIWQILTHFSLNFVVTSFGLALFFQFYQIFIIALFTLSIITINYLSLLFLMRKKAIAMN